MEPRNNDYRSIQNNYISTERTEGLLIQKSYISLVIWDSN